MNGQVRAEILRRLEGAEVTLSNQSGRHAGHYAGKETHFDLLVVSEVFSGMRPAARHQWVYARLGDLLKSQGGEIHALSIVAKTPTEWKKSSGGGQSPDCLGRNPEIT